MTPKRRSPLAQTAKALALAALPAALSVQAQFFDPADEPQVESLLAQLTLEEKVGLLHGSGMFFSAGVPRLGIPEFEYSDGPLGVREEISRDSWAPVGRDDDFATYFPSGTALAATWDPELAYQYGVAIGSETRARGKDMLLAPAMNVIRSPLCGRNYEYFSEEPLLSAALATPYVKGVQEQDVIACLKHFVANNQETDRGSISVELSERALREVYLRAFERVIKEADAGAVMGSYNRVRGTYVCENPYLLTDVLKTEWGFPGVVVSDWAATHSTLESARAGLDVEMGTVGPFDDYFLADPLLDAVRSGQLDEAVVDGMARRVLRVMVATGKLDPNRKQGEINTERHARIIRDVAESAIVLLENRLDLLPLDLSQYERIAVIGDNATRQHAQGGFGASVKASYEITPLDGLRNAIGDRAEIAYARGYRPQYINTAGPNRPVWEQTIDHSLDPELLQEALDIAADADLVIFVGGTDRNVESEAADRTSLQLPFGQDALLTALKAVNPRLLTVVVSGAPVDLNLAKEKSAALVWAWFNGSESGNALADTLLGAVTPSGKLPFTLPASLDQIGAHALNAFPGNGATVEYKEGLLVGYRYLDAHGLEPTYPFGFGRSYTDFAMTEPSVSGNALRIELKNVGDRPGAEVVQVYAAFPGQQEGRPLRQLAAFRKVELQPGESKQITLPIPRHALEQWVDARQGFQLAEGDYVLHVGNSSRNLPYALPFRYSE